ncbi:activated RNA polymerase II transcriptional coactivator p15 [Anoplophora glabripennis]|uniref:Activated RNA polymerase II transcriptional coactivator n=1 Tax=Anoplophora glabripennis TaxID=217634 RepID=V5I9F3_ANOGL|nr:activated RNA polymerase II transcriptional coactivator p15 [Anoplophora glabripennis]
MPKHKPTKDESSDSDSGPEDRGPIKKPKSDVKPKPSNSSEDENSWDLGKNRFVKLSEFKGKWYVNIREFYNDDGELKPGKKGIMLTMEQWQKFKNCISELDDAIKRNV